METPYGDIPDNFVADMSPQDMHDYLKARYRRRTVLRVGATGAATAAASTLFWRQSTAWASTQTQPQWIAYGADPATQMYVSWGVGSATVAGTVTSAQVQYGTDTTYGTVVSASTSTVPVPSSPAGEPAENAKYNSALLSNLSPGTTYHYQVSNDGGSTWSSDVTLSTARSGAVDYRWAATADEATSQNVTANIATLIAAQNPEFVLVAGDLSYASGGTYPSGVSGSSTSGFNPSAWDMYLAAVGPTAAQGIPWQVGVGNHELEPLTDDGYIGFVTRFPQSYAGTAASGSPVTHTFVRGNVAFICLDGNDLSAEISNNNGYTAGKQTSWLEQTLIGYNQPTSGVDFIVVYFHNCVFCSNQTHGSDNGVRSIWQPLFDKYNVDLVINGHVHAYERSYPVSGTTVTIVAQGSTYDSSKVGTTYLLAGGGGQSLYTTWYGSTGSGDAGTGTPMIYEYSGGETASGGSGTSGVRVNDGVTGFSAFRKAVFSFVTFDVVAPTAANGGVTTMTLKAYDPTQTGTSNTAGVVSTSSPTLMDTVTISRQSAIRSLPAANLPEAETPSLLLAGGLALGGAALAARHVRRSRSERLAGVDLTDVRRVEVGGTDPQ